MVTTKRVVTSKKGIKKLKLKRETLKDLQVKDKSGLIRGGQAKRNSVNGAC